MKSQNCVTILAILNAMIARVSSSFSQIDDATRGLWREQASAVAGAGVINGSASTEEQFR